MTANLTSVFQLPCHNHSPASWRPWSGGTPQSVRKIWTWPYPDSLYPLVVCHLRHPFLSRLIVSFSCISIQTRPYPDSSYTFNLVVCQSRHSPIQTYHILQLYVNLDTSLPRLKFQSELVISRVCVQMLVGRNCM